MIQPRTGASVAIFRDNRVLLVKRTKPPYENLWSLPGGRQHGGETMEQTARRELAEETGLQATTLRFVELQELIICAPDGTLEAHFVLGVHTGTDTGGEARAGDDAGALCWADISELDRLDMTPGTAAIIRRAKDLPGKT